MKQRRIYTREFKEEAVSLVIDQGYSVPEAASSLGIASNVLYTWKQKVQDEKMGKMLNTDEKSELLALRKENKRLRMEKEILKKASVDSRSQCNTCHIFS